MSYLKTKLKWQEQYKLDWCDRLLYFLRKNNIKRSVLADQCEISYSALTLWLSRKRTPSLEMLCKVAEVLRVEPEWLIFGAHSEDYFSRDELEILELIKNMEEEKQINLKKKLIDPNENFV